MKTSQERRQHDRAGTARPPLPEARAAFLDSTWAGDRIGGYQRPGQLGERGFGVLWMAERRVQTMLFCLLPSMRIGFGQWRRNLASLPVKIPRVASSL